MLREADVYFEARLAFVDRPNARIYLRGHEGGLRVIVEEPIPANPGEPDHLKHMPWVWMDAQTGHQEVMQPRVVCARMTVDGETCRGGAPIVAEAMAARLRRAWEREQLVP